MARRRMIENRAAQKFGSNFFKAHDLFFRNVGGGYIERIRKSHGGIYRQNEELVKEQQVDPHPRHGNADTKHCRYAQIGLCAAVKAECIPYRAPQPCGNKRQTDYPELIYRLNYRIVRSLSVQSHACIALAEQREQPIGTEFTQVRQPQLGTSRGELGKVRSVCKARVDYRPKLFEALRPRRIARRPEGALCRSRGCVFPSAPVSMQRTDRQ